MKLRRDLRLLVVLAILASASKPSFAQEGIGRACFKDSAGLDVFAGV